MLSLIIIVGYIIMGMVTSKVYINVHCDGREYNDLYRIEQEEVSFAFWFWWFWLPHMTFKWLMKHIL